MRLDGTIVGNGWSPGGNDRETDTTSSINNSSRKNSNPNIIQLQWRPSRDEGGWSNGKHNGKLFFIYTALNLYIEMGSSIS